MHKLISLLILINCSMASFDLRHVYSNRSLNMFYDLLPEFLRYLNGKCKRDFKPIEIDGFINVKL